jgi:hypothetical protein
MNLRFPKTSAFSIQVNRNIYEVFISEIAGEVEMSKLGVGCIKKHQLHECGGQQGSLKLSTHILIPAPCEYITIHGKRVDVVWR